MLSAEDEYYVEELKTLLNDLYTKFGHITEVTDVLKKFRYLWEESYWDSLFAVHANWETSLNTPMGTDRKKVPECMVLIQAIESGIQPGKSSSEYSIQYESFRTLYIFFEKLYSLDLGRRLIEDDIWALHKSDLVERVLGGLEQFDVFGGNLFLEDEFFKRIQMVYWDDEAELFLKNFHNLLFLFLFEKQGKNAMAFTQELKNVVVLLAYSSATWSDSHAIDIQHVLRAYKTLFKIITSDFTFLVDKRYYNGHLICKACSESYELCEDEAPHDFSQCHCGGELKYVSYP